MDVDGTGADRAEAGGRGLGWAMATGLALRLLLVVTSAGHATERFTFVDSDSYLRVARAMPSVLWAPTDQLLSSSLGRTPGYPLVAWAGGGARSIVVLIVAQCLLGAIANVWLAHRLARRIAGPSAALLAAWIVALDPVTIGVNLLVATETLAATLVLSATFAAHRALRPAERDGDARPWRWALLAGLAAGAAGLTRPNLVVLVPFLALVVASASRLGPTSGTTSAPTARGRVALGAVVLVAGTFPLAAWLARNEAVAGSPVLATVAGQNLADFGLAATAWEQGRLGSGPIDRASYDEVLGPIAMEEGLSPPVDGDLTSTATSARWSDEGLALLRSHPRGAMAVAASGVVRAQVAPGASLAVGHLPRPWDDRALSVAQVAAAAWLLAVQLGALAGAVVLARARRWAALALVAGTVVLVALSAAGPWMDARFRVPTVPLVAVLAGLGLHQLWTACARRCAPRA